jgi:hypothetical protein
MGCSVPSGDFLPNPSRLHAALTTPDVGDECTHGREDDLATIRGG